MYLLKSHLAGDVIIRSNSRSVTSRASDLQQQTTQFHIYAANQRRNNRVFVSSQSPDQEIIHRVDEPKDNRMKSRLRIGGSLEESTI